MSNSLRKNRSFRTSLAVIRASEKQTIRESAVFKDKEILGMRYDDGYYVVRVRDKRKKAGYSLYLVWVDAKTIEPVTSSSGVVEYYLKYVLRVKNPSKKYSWFVGGVPDKNLESVYHYRSGGSS